MNTTAYPVPCFQKAEYPNLRILENLSQINNLDLDLVIFNSREMHHPHFNLPRVLHVPALIIDHDINATNDFFLKQIKAQTPYPTVSTNEFVRKQFDCVKNINYGIEQKRGEYTKDIDILVCGNFPDTDIFFLNSLKQAFPGLKLIGHNPNAPYSESVETFEDYKGLFKRTNVFLNLALQKNIQYEILWALQNNCAIISHITPVYDGLLNKENCTAINTSDEVLSSLKNLANNKATFKKMTSYTTNLDAFNMDNFVSEWKELLETYRYKVYIP